MFTITIHFDNQKTMDIFRGDENLQNLLINYHKGAKTFTFKHGRSTYVIDFSKVTHIVSWSDENGGRPL